MKAYLSITIFKYYYSGKNLANLYFFFLLITSFFTFFGYWAGSNKVIQLFSKSLQIYSNLWIA